MIPLEQNALRQSFPSVVVFFRRSANRIFKSMKNKSLIALSLFPLLLASCADQVGGEDYDVSNPYAAPDYDTAGSTNRPSDVNLPSDVNPAYDQAAAYEETTPAVPDSAAPEPAARASVHTVASGDSLWSISKKYGVSIDAIKQANGMTRDIAVLGAKLKIPAQ